MDSESEHPIPPPVTGSAVRSPPHHPSPPPLPPPYSALVPRAASILEEPAAAGSPIQSPPRSATVNQTASPNHTTATAPPASSGIKDEAVTGSPVRSPLQSAEAEARYERENSSGSSFRSSCGDAENPFASPGDVMALALVPRAMSIRDEAVAGSPVRSPHREVNSSPARSGAPPRYEKDNSFKSVPSFRSPLCDAENPTASPQYKESVFGSPTVPKPGKLIRIRKIRTTSRNSLSCSKKCGIKCILGRPALHPRHQIVRIPPVNFCFRLM